jgi:sortase A
VVDPSDVWVLDPSPDDRLTLTTCNPRFSAAERLVIVAKLVSPPAPTPVQAPAQTTATTTPSAPRTLAAGLSGKATSRTPAIVWGAFAAAIWLGGWFLGRAWRRWPAYAVTAIPFLLVLFVFYENVSRLLPANV